MIKKSLFLTTIILISAPLAVLAIDNWEAKNGQTDSEIQKCVNNLKNQNKNIDEKEILIKCESLYNRPIVTPTPTAITPDEAKTSTPPSSGGETIKIEPIESESAPTSKTESSLPKIIEPTTEKIPTSTSETVPSAESGGIAAPAVKTEEIFPSDFIKTSSLKIETQTEAGQIFYRLNQAFETKEETAQVPVSLDFKFNEPVEFKPQEQKIIINDEQVIDYKNVAKQIDIMPPIHVALQSGVKQNDLYDLKIVPQFDSAIIEFTHNEQKIITSIEDEFKIADNKFYLTSKNKSYEVKVLPPEVYSALLGGAAKVIIEGKITGLTDFNQIISASASEIKSTKLKIENEQPIYKVELSEPFKLFWLIPVKINRQAEVSGSDGKIIANKMPWFSIFGRSENNLDEGFDIIGTDRARSEEILRTADQPQVNFSADVNETGENDPVVFSWNVEPSPISNSPIERIELKWFTLVLNSSTNPRDSFTYNVDMEAGLWPFVLTARDSNGRVGQQVVTVRIVGRPVIASFIATPNRLDRERGNITLAWSTRDVSRVELSADPASPDGRTILAFPTGLPTSGSFETEPIDTTTYNLRVYNSLGDHADRTVRAEVVLPDLIIDRFEPAAPSTLRDRRGFSEIKIAIKNITETNFLGILNVSGDCGAGHCWYYNPTFAANIEPGRYHNFIIYRGDAPAGMSPVENFICGETYNFNFSFITDKLEKEYANNNNYAVSQTIRCD